MERTEVLDMMGELKLYGMKAAYDETLATALKRKHEPQRFGTSAANGAKVSTALMWARLARWPQRGIGRGVGSTEFSGASKPLVRTWQMM